MNNSINNQTESKNLKPSQINFLNLINEDMELTLKIVDLLPPYMKEIFKSRFLGEKTKEEFCKEHNIQEESYLEFVKRSRRKFKELYNLVKSGVSFEELINRDKPKITVSVEKLLREKPALVKNLVKTLSPKQAKVFALYHFEEKSKEDICSELGITYQRLTDIITKGNRRILEQAGQIPMYKRKKRSSLKSNDNLSTAFVAANIPVFTVKNEADVLDALKECPPRLADAIFRAIIDINTRKICMARYINKMKIINIVDELNLNEEYICNKLENGGKTFLETYYYMRRKYEGEKFSQTEYPMGELVRLVSEENKQARFAAAERRRALIEIMRRNKD